MCALTVTIRIFRVVCVIAMLLSASGRVGCAQVNTSLPPELNTILMESTYFIYGPDKSDGAKVTFGTAFLMGKPTPTPNTLYRAYPVKTHTHYV
jgi:hypothetical protein